MSAMNWSPFSYNELYSSSKCACAICKINPGNLSSLQADRLRDVIENPPGVRLDTGIFGDITSFGAVQIPQDISPQVASILSGFKTGTLGARGNETVTYSFITSETAQRYYQNLPKQEQGNNNGPVQPLSEQAKQAVRKAAAEWNRILPFTLVEVGELLAGDITASGRMRFGLTKQDDTYGFAYYPRNDDFKSISMDVFLSQTHHDNNFFTTQAGGFSTILHEIGHALGLKHPGAYGETDRPPFLQVGLDNGNATIMSYNRNRDIDRSIGLLDVNAIETLYGSLRPNSGESDLLFGNNLNGGLPALHAQRVFDSSGGFNTINLLDSSFSATGTSLVVRLEPQSKELSNEIDPQLLEIVPELSIYSVKGPVPNIFYSPGFTQASLLSLHSFTPIQIPGILSINFLKGPMFTYRTRVENILAGSYNTQYVFTRDNTSESLIYHRPDQIYGSDILYNAEGEDFIFFDEATLDELNFGRGGNDLQVLINNRSTLLIKDYFEYRPNLFYGGSLNGFLGNDRRFGTELTADSIDRITGSPPEELPLVSVSVAPSRVVEDTADNLVFTFTRTGSATGPLEVSYDIAGTAGNGVDLEGLPVPPAQKIINFIPGSTTAELIVGVIPDATPEPDETISLSIVPRDSYSMDSNSNAIAVIVDNDTVDSTPPVLEQIRVQGASLFLDFDELINPGSLSTKPFRVKVNGRRARLSSVFVPDDDDTAVLSLRKSVASGSTVVVSYIDRPGNQATGVLQDIHGNDVQTFLNNPAVFA